MLFGRFSFSSMESLTMLHHGHLSVPLSGRLQTLAGLPSAPPCRRPCLCQRRLYRSCPHLYLRHGTPPRPVLPAAVSGGDSPAAAVPFSAKPSSKRGVSSQSPPDEKLARLRKLFDSVPCECEGTCIDAYIVPSEDPHQSEFIAECYMRRAYISGFTGSAGIAVITRDKAALWTDGRYFLQAEKQLGSEWQLMRAGLPGVPSWSEWLRDTLSPGSKVGVDPFLITSDAATDLKQCLLEKEHGLVLLPQVNLVDEAWGDGRPNPPSAPLRVHPIKYAGVDVASKLRNLRNQISSAGATAIVLTMLDDIAWLFNIRGGDVPRSPVVYAYALVDLEGATLFVDNHKITEEVDSHLREAQVKIKPYEQLMSTVERLAVNGEIVLIDTTCASVAVVDTFNAACLKHCEGLKNSNKTANGSTDSDLILNERKPAILVRQSPITLMKAIKNVAELNGMKEAHLRDAAALVEFFTWLEDKISIEKSFMTEAEVADILFDFRSKQEGFLDTSFDTISGSGPNGAIIHYRAEPGTCGMVDDKKLFLLDSGGQYVDGTTDITRTVHFGIPSARHKECFTRVLKGHIAIDMAVFPEDTPGFVLDVLARSSLWKSGLDYRHGTGHGVGAALNVHEGPHSISARFGNMVGLEQGMIVSNEPGYYEDRSFGIRIENLLVVREERTANNYGGVSYLGFDKLTFVPIQAKLLEMDLLSDEEIKWLNSYHAQVWEKVSPRVKGSALEWLRKNTSPITKGDMVESI